ncbi:hypothetical protein [Geminocystis herdmanii]|uniref:hypothetical protein n=1 Tax=Geminocystis herdmanii TaxID=669359 RepID=UPI00034A2E76|nr:hypothetical protein [Geminocystis herdmanii]
MSTLIDIVSNVYQEFLDFETEKKDTYEKIEDLEDFLEESNQLTAENYASLTDISETFIEEIDNISENFIDEISSMLEELDSLGEHIDQFITETETLAQERKQEVIDLVDKMGDYNQQVNDSIEQLSNIVNHFNETVTEIKPPLESNLNKVTTFIKDVMIRGIKNYQNIIEDSEEKLEELLAENINNALEEETENLQNSLDDIGNNIENIENNYQENLENITEYLVNFYGDKSNYLQDKYQEIFTLIQEDSIEMLKNKEQEINEENNNLKEVIETVLVNYSDINNNAESLMEIFEKLIK